MSGKRKKAKFKPEFSKFILAVSALECWIVTGAALVMAWIGKDTSVFCYLIPSSWGAYGISRAFYYNKANQKTRSNFGRRTRRPGWIPRQRIRNLNRQCLKKFRIKLIKGE